MTETRNVCQIQGKEVVFAAEKSNKYSILIAEMVTRKKKRLNTAPDQDRIYLVCFLFSGLRGIPDELTPMSPCAFTPGGKRTALPSPEANPLKAWTRHPGIRN